MKLEHVMETPVADETVAGVPIERDDRVTPANPPKPAPTHRPQVSPGAGAWGLSLAVLITGTFMSVLDTSVVNVAMSVLSKEFGASADSVQWVSTVYNLAEGVAIPTGAWLGARFGLKRVYLVTLVLFTAASALCGMSSGLPELIAFRILQAIPGGIMPVACQTILYRIVPREKRGAAMGIYGVGVIVAAAIGPSVGGLLIDYLGWRYIFLINVPVGILGVLAAASVLRPQPAERARPFDLPGFLCIGTALFSLLLAFEEGSKWGWTSYPVLILLAGAVNLIGLFVIVETHVQHPLLDLRAFRHGAYTLAIVLISCLFIALTCVMFYTPLYLQRVRNLSALDAGLLMLPQGLTMLVLMPLSGILYDRFGARWLAVGGLSLTGVGIVLLSRITVDTPYSTVKFDLVVMAAGIGLSMMPIMTSGLSALPSEVTDSGSAMNTAAQRVAGAFGLALLTALVTANQAQFWADRSALLPATALATDPRITALHQQGESGLVAVWQQLSNIVLTEAYRNGYLVAAAVAFLGAALALLLRSTPPAAGADKPMAH
jgi:EmrB/QacA subfamily drug resistance transporter